MNWYVYILECSDKTFYIGTTNDVEERLEKHNSGKGAKYTRGRTPVKIKFTMECKDRAEACQYEYKLKKYSREEKLELIKTGSHNSRTCIT